MKFYYQKAACSLAVRIILNEVGASFEEEAVDLKTKICKNGKDFRKINPKGSVPTLELEGGVVLTENAVILQYLAHTYDKNNLLPARDDFEHYRILEWLNFVATELHKGFSPLFNPMVPAEVKERVFKPLLKSKFTYINNHLEHHSYLHHKHFTLPDAYLYVMIRWAIAHGVVLSDLTHLAQYVLLLNQKKSIKDSLMQEQLSMVVI